MDWIPVASLILVGVVLIVVEIIIIPGTTIVGIIGFCLAMAGVILCFTSYGTTAGLIALGGTAATSGLAIYWSLHTRVWDRFSLKSAIESKVNEGEKTNLLEGMEGVTTSSLRPSGKANINGKLYEVTTHGNYVEAGTSIKIIKLSSNQIIVEPIN